MYNCIYLVSTAFLNWERENAATKGLVNYCDDYECELLGVQTKLLCLEAEFRMFKENFLAGRQSCSAFKENFLAGRRNFPAFKETSLIGGRILSDDQRKLLCWEAQLPSIQRKLPG
jgi:hypothetical protein